MTNPTTHDKPKQEMQMPENRNDKSSIDNIKSLDSDLTIKRKRLVRQEATTQCIDDDDDDKDKDDRVKTELNSETKPAVGGLKGRSGDQVTETDSTECTIRSKTKSVRQHNQNKTAHEITTDKNDSRTEHKRKQSSKHRETPCFNSHSTERSVSLNSQPGGSSSTPCPSYSLDTWAMSEIWQPQLGTLPNLKTPDHDTSRMEREGQGNTDDIMMIRKWQIQPGACGMIETSSIPAIPAAEIRKTQKEQTNVQPIGTHTGHQSIGSLTPQGNRSRHGEYNDPHRKMEGKTQHEQTGIPGNLTMERKRSHQQDSTGILSIIPVADNKRPEPQLMATAGHRSPLPIAGHVRIQQQHPGVLDMTTQVQNRSEYISHDNRTYQEIPPEYLSHSPRLENSPRPMTKANLPNIQKQHGHELATPNCILLIVGFVLIGIVIIMMVFMDSMDRVSMQ